MGRKPDLQGIRTANTINPVSKSAARSGWFQFLGWPSVQRYGPKPLLAMNAAVPERWAASSSGSKPNAPSCHHNPTGVTIPAAAC